MTDENKRFRPITDWCTHKALFFDDNGVYVGSKSLKYKHRTFSFHEQTYNFMPNEATYFKIKGIWKTTKFYQYNVNNPMPLIIGKTVDPIIRADVYKTILDSDLVKKLNPNKNNLFDMIGGWKGVILILIILCVLGYFLSGGDVSTASSSVKGVK